MHALRYEGWRAWYRWDARTAAPWPSNRTCSKEVQPSMLRVLISAWPHFLAKHEGRATSQMIAEVAARVETMLLTHGNRQGAARKRRELLGGEGEEVRRR